MGREIQNSNLKPFKKGDDERRTNNGRKPKLPDLNVLLAKVLGAETNGKTAAEKILSALHAKAARGDIRAAELLLDRGYGKPKQSIETNITGNINLIFETSQDCEPLPNG